jgi:hypothetical protein
MEQNTVAPKLNWQSRPDINDTLPSTKEVISHVGCKIAITPFGMFFISQTTVTAQTGEKFDLPFSVLWEGNCITAQQKSQEEAQAFAEKVNNQRTQALLQGIKDAEAATADAATPNSDAVPPAESTPATTDEQPTPVDNAPATDGGS